MWIRYFADTSDGAHGQVARAWVSTLLKIAPVVIVTTSPGMPTEKWAVWGPLFRAPLDGPFVNVVCAHPTKWAWNQNLVASVSEGRAETTSHRIELYTAGVRNVLIHGFGPRDADHTAAATRYEAMVVMDEASAMLWEMAGVARPHVLHPGDNNGMRSVIIPET